MYMVADWKIVYSIYLVYTCVNLPNLRHNTFILEYSYVIRWITIQVIRYCGYEAMPLRGRVTGYCSLVDSRW